MSKTEVAIHIERRESGCSEWSLFSQLTDEAFARKQIKLWEEDFPLHHFRAVRVTTTREIIR